MEPITFLLLAAAAVGVGATWYSYKRRNGINNTKNKK